MQHGTVTCPKFFTESCTLIPTLSVRQTLDVALSALGMGDKVGIRHSLDSMVFRVFPNLNNSVIFVVFLKIHSAVAKTGRRSFSHNEIGLSSGDHGWALPPLQ